MIASEQNSKEHYLMVCALSGIELNIEILIIVLLFIEEYVIGAILLLLITFSSMIIRLGKMKKVYGRKIMKI